MRTVTAANGFKVTFKEKDLEGYRFNMHEALSGSLQIKGGISIPVGGQELAKIIQL